MQKPLLIAVIAIVIVAAVGAFFFIKKDAQSPAAEDLAKETTELGMMAEKSGVVGSIKDAMGLNKKMTCTYSGASGENAFTSTVYIEGKKFKTEAEVNGVKTHALFDGETQYMWTDGQAQGFKMTKACLDELQGSWKDMPANAPKPTDYEESFDAAQNVKCEESGTADFSMPAGVTFADQCAMMKQSMDAMKQMQGQMGGQMPQAMPGQTPAQTMPSPY